MNFLHDVLDAINESDNEGRLLQIENLEGYSGDKVIGCLQRCAQLILLEQPGGCYLEIRSVSRTDNGLCGFCLPGAAMSWNR
jgi:hypothetical protein